ncbi:MAG TPA: hypothetical protein VFU10_07890 [Gaiellaceae bacterium]|nr:hypothetical protein [Gaiellaceae bacterium]
MSAYESAWADRVTVAAVKAVADLRADDAFAHRSLIEELEGLIRVIAAAGHRAP